MRIDVSYLPLRGTFSIQREYSDRYRRFSCSKSTLPIRGDTYLACDCDCFPGNQQYPLLPSRMLRCLVFSDFPCHFSPTFVPCHPPSHSHTHSFTIRITPSFLPSLHSSSKNDSPNRDNAPRTALSCREATPSWCPCRKIGPSE